MKLIINLIRLIFPAKFRDFVRYRLKKFKLILKLFNKDLNILNCNKKSDFTKFRFDNEMLDLLYNYNRFFGSFTNISLLRNLRINLDNKVKKKNYKLSKISILFEKGKFDKLLTILNNSKNDNDNKILLLNIFFKKINKKFYKSYLHSKFYELVNNKSIAIVGPGNCLIKQGEEIESYDLIVRTNLTNEKNFNKELFGSRTDISYYNDAYWLDHNKHIIQTDKKIWKIFKTSKIYNQFLKKNNFKTNNHRLMNTTLDIFSNFSSSSHAIPNIIFDLKLYDPSKIKLFNANQYIDGLNYYDTYQNLRKNRKFELSLASKELRNHDPFFNYHIIKNFYKNNIIDLDNYSLQPIISGEKKYAKALDFFFKDFTF